MKRAGLKLESSTSLGGMCFDSGDRVGLVGLFPSLVRQFLGVGVDFVVIERKQALLNPEAGYEISLDPARLKDCNKMLITGSTLLNRSLDEVLHHCRPASRVAVIGPTASCLPDMAFAAGVHSMGGIVVRDLPSLSGRAMVQGGVTRSTNTYSMPIAIRASSCWPNDFREANRVPARRGSRQRRCLGSSGPIMTAPM